MHHIENGKIFNQYIDNSNKVKEMVTMKKAWWRRYYSYIPPPYVAISHRFGYPLSHPPVTSILSVTILETQFNCYK